MDSTEKLTRILRTTPEVLRHVNDKMGVYSGQKDVLESIVQQNDIIVERTLSELGLSGDSGAEEVYDALIQQLINIDKHLFELLDKPDLAKMALVCGKLCETALKVFTPPKGFFIKEEKVVELLEAYKPDNLLAHFGYSTVAELVEKEGFSSVVASLRFAQTKEWMHKFFDEAYSRLTADDFEEREVELKVLDPKWLEVAEKFLEKKYHNVSHLKEYGVIFVIPLKIDTPGETLRLFTLILHYLHEVPFYSALFRKFKNDPDFTDKIKSLLRGDVSEGPAPDGTIMTWRVVQRYLAKDDENDFRLKEPHVNPEAEHWLRAEEDLGRLSRMLGGEEQGIALGYWTGLDYVGGFFKNKEGQEVLVSFDLIDLIMSLVKKGEIKYLYHQEEALWNKIFSEYMGREKMNQLIDENIIEGFIHL
ncbi:MAG: hypothetical protein Q8P35_01705 [Candidatus Yanofskybacteria bacterium]|nr:hypothetical protein [Candidatus Yanofskybacteria bacterium]